MKLIAIFTLFFLQDINIVAQTNGLTDNNVLKDSLISKFNRNDFDGFYELGNAEWKKKTKQEDINGWLQYIFSMTGTVIAAEPYKTSGGYTYYKWEGMRKIMCFTLQPDSAGGFNNFQFHFFKRTLYLLKKQRKYLQTIH